MSFMDILKNKKSGLKDSDGLDPLSKTIITTLRKYREMDLKESKTLIRDMKDVKNEYNQLDGVPQLDIFNLDDINNSEWTYIHHKSFTDTERLEEDEKLGITTSKDDTGKRKIDGFKVLNILKNAIDDVEKNITKDKYPEAYNLLLEEKKRKSGLIFRLKEIYGIPKKNKSDKEIEMFKKILNTGKITTNSENELIKRLAESLNGYLNNNEKIPKRYTKIITDFGFIKSKKILYAIFDKLDITFDNQFISDKSTELLTEYFGMDYESTIKFIEEFIEPIESNNIELIKEADEHLPLLFKKNNDLIGYEIISKIIILEDEIGDNGIDIEKDKPDFKEFMLEIESNLKILRLIISCMVEIKNPMKQSRIDDLNESIKDLNDKSNEITLIDADIPLDGVSIKELYELSKEVKPQKRQWVKDINDDGYEMTEDFKDSISYSEPNEPLAIIDNFKELVSKRKKISKALNGILSELKIADWNEVEQRWKKPLNSLFAGLGLRRHENYLIKEKYILLEKLNIEIIEIETEILDMLDTTLNSKKGEKLTIEQLTERVDASITERENKSNINKIKELKKKYVKKLTKLSNLFNGVGALGEGFGDLPDNTKEETHRIKRKIKDVNASQTGDNIDSLKDEADSWFDTLRDLKLNRPAQIQHMEFIKTLKEKQSKLTNPTEKQLDDIYNEYVTSMKNNGLEKLIISKLKNIN